MVSAWGWGEGEKESRPISARVSVLQDEKFERFAVRQCVSS